MIGSVGFVPVLFPGILPLGLIRVNKETGEPERDANGLCIRCKPGKKKTHKYYTIIGFPLFKSFLRVNSGEPGEFVGEIVKNHPARDFHGYADKAATAKKILLNVWKKGDICFRSGDILVMDKFGFLYFKVQ